MNCENCHAKCKAECCGIVPLPRETVAKFSFVREPVNRQDIGDVVFATDKDNYCCYLGEDLKCTIYNDRPEVCRKYGDESYLLMTCKWQGFDGRIRDRAERRRIQAEQEKDQIRVLKDFKKIAHEKETKK